MSALFTAVLNIHLKLQKQNALKQLRETIWSLWLNISGICARWDKQATTHPENNLSYTWVKTTRLCSKLRLIRNDLFLGRGSDCTIMSGWREEKMYNALSPLLSWGWEEGQFLWDIQVLVMDLCICVFVRAFARMCMRVDVLVCLYEIFYTCVHRKERIWPPLVRDLTLRNSRQQKGKDTNLWNSIDK